MFGNTNHDRHDEYYPIEAAIHTGDIAYARELLRDILRARPTGHAWYLAAQVASDMRQRVHLLQKALEADPEHPHARAALDETVKAATLSRRPTNFLHRVRAALSDSADT